MQCCNPSEVELAFISRACYNINYETNILQSVGRRVGVDEPRSALASLCAGDRVPNSAANPLPSVFYGSKFRCLQTHSSRNQSTDIQYVLASRECFSRAARRVFPAIRENGPVRQHLSQG